MPRCRRGIRRLLWCSRVYRPWDRSRGPRGGPGARKAGNLRRWPSAAGSPAPDRPLSTRLAASEFALENLRDGPHVGLAARRSHRLPYQEIDHRSLAAAVLLDLLRVVRDHFVQDAVELGGIADLPQSLALHDRAGRAPAGEHLGEDLLGELAGNFALGDHAHELAQILRGNRRFGDIAPFRLEQANEVAHHPVGG